MIHLDCTLISDGSSDAALIPVLDWLLRQHRPNHSQRIHRYDPSVYRRPPRTLAERIVHAVDNFPCNLLFIHRDAEAEPHEPRAAEIHRALRNASDRGTALPAVLVIPVRMTEAWFLFDEQCIRQAAGWPRGTSDLCLPGIGECERIGDPKARLRDCLRAASGAKGRRLKKFNIDSAIHRLAELIPDYSPLRRLAAFQRLEAELKRAVESNRWA